MAKRKGTKKTTVKSTAKRGLPTKKTSSKRLTRRAHGTQGTISEREQY